MTDYLNLAKELSRKHCLTVGNAHQTLADILQEVIEAERTACMRVAEMAKLMLDPDKGQYEKGWFDAATRIAEDIEERK